jgi:hypothetical protein
LGNTKRLLGIICEEARVFEKLKSKTKRFNPVLASFISNVPTKKDADSPEEEVTKNQNP